MLELIVLEYQSLIRKLLKTYGLLNNRITKE